VSLSPDGAFQLYEVRPQDKPKTQRRTALALTTCIECQHQISDSASRCPACSTLEPFGVVCELCGERMRRSTGITSTRSERTGHRGDRDHFRSNSWHFDEPVDRGIVAHQQCLERVYTPPTTLTCKDCSTSVATADLGMTALTLWNATARLTFTCVSCGAHCSLSTAQCKWAPRVSPHVSSIFETHLDAWPCFRPLYSFQGGRGHGRHPQQEGIEAWKGEQLPNRASQEAQANRQAAEMGAKRFVGGAAGVVIGGIVGFVAAMIMTALLIFFVSEDTVNILGNAVIALSAVLGGILGASK